MDLGGLDLVGTDGLIRRGTTVYVVENPAGQIWAAKIGPEGSSGVVTNTPVVGAETPMTAGLFGDAVDARFTSMSDPYDAFRVELQRRNRLERRTVGTPARPEPDRHRVTFPPLTW